MQEVGSSIYDSDQFCLHTGHNRNASELDPVCLPGNCMFSSLSQKDTDRPIFCIQALCTLVIHPAAFPFRVLVGKSGKEIRKGFCKCSEHQSKPALAQRMRLRTELRLVH